MTERKTKIEQGNYNENIGGDYKEEKNIIVNAPISVTQNYFSDKHNDKSQKNISPNMLAKTKQLIQEGDLKKATQQLLEFIKSNSPRYENEVIVHKANVNKLIEKERRRTTREETIAQEKNIIMYALLDLIDVIEEEISKQK